MNTNLVTMPNVKDKAIWKLPDILKREGVTPYKLHQIIDGNDAAKASRNTIYRWSNELPDNLDVALLMSVIWGLEELTGNSYTVSDLLDYER